MWFNFTVNGNKHWVELVSKLVTEYNNTFHRTIRMTPTFASMKENEQKVRENLFKLIRDKQDRLSPHARFHVGDLVRIYKWKKMFEKGYETNFTKEVFRITEVLQTIPVTYKIQALDSEEIIGSFYEPELVKVNN